MIIEEEYQLLNSREILQNPNDKNNTFKNMPLLTYRFIDTFPVNINAVPMSYDGSTIYKLQLFLLT